MPRCSSAADGVMDANQARALAKPAKRLFCGVELGQAKVDQQLPIACETLLVTSNCQLGNEHVIYFAAMTI